MIEDFSTHFLVDIYTDTLQNIPKTNKYLMILIDKQKY